MKEYLILKSFPGSQSGHDHDQFVAGTTRKLSDALVKSLGGIKGGFVKPVEAAAVEIAKAPPALSKAVLDTIATAEERDTKVTGPDETKVVEPDEKKTKKK